LPGWKSHSSQAEAVALVEGAQKLIDVYGYWLSFHDAVVESIIIEREGPTVTICFTTNDMVEKAGGEDPDHYAKVTLRWYEVKELTLTGIDESNWIDGLIFTRSEDEIRCEIERMDGFHGTILARRIEVLDVQPDLPSTPCP
jgi:Immunity protein 50